MITGKTIGELTQLNTMISDTLIPVELSGSTYYVNHSSLTSSGSFSSRITNLVTDSASFSSRIGSLVTASGSFSTRSTNLETASGSFSSRVSGLETSSGSFSTRVTNLVTDSSSFSTRLTTDASNISSLSSASASFSTRVSDLKTDSGSFSTRSTALETASGSFSARVTNLVSDSSSFSNRITYFTGSVFGTSSKVVNGVYTTDTGSVSNNMLAGSISNSKLINSSILIGSSSVSLGATASSFTGLDSVSANSITVAGQPTTYGVVNPDYINAGRISSDQTSMGVNSDIIFNAWVINNGVSLNTTTGVFTLAANKTYKLFSELSFSNFSDVTNGFVIYNWVDATTNTKLDTSGISVGVGENINRNTNEFNATSTTLIYTPTTNQTVKVRITEAVGTVTVRSAIGTKAIIEQINPTIAVQATATGTVSTNYAKYTRSTQQTSLSNGSVVVCNVLENTSGTAISVNISTGQITLAAGKTYRLKGMIPGFSTSGATVRPQFCWYNETALTYIGTSAESYTPGDAAGYGAFGGAAEAIITTAATTVTSFRLLAGATNLSGIGGNTDFSTTGSYPWIDIQEIGASFALNALDTMTLTGAISASGNITGNTLISSVASGNEGGEIQLAKSPNSTLSGSNVVIDQYIDRIRIFEAGGSTRGAYIDLTQAAGGVGTLLNNRVSGFVNAGTFVTMDNIKATVTTGGNRGLSLATTTGTLTYNIGGTFGGSAVGSGGAGASNQSLTTTATTSIFGWGFTATGDTATYILNDLTNSRAYRITLQIATSFNSNLISIERLV